MSWVLYGLRQEKKKNTVRIEARREGADAFRTTEGEIDRRRAAPQGKREELNFILTEAVFGGTASVGADAFVSRLFLAG